MGAGTFSDGKPSGEDLANRFGYHAPQHEGVVAAHTAIRDNCLDLAHGIVALTPPCREQSLALTALEETMMWANAAIARHDAETGGRR